MATLSEEQFKTLCPAVLGPMRPFIMDTNKMIRLKAFEEWLEEAENRMTYVGTTQARI